MATPLVPIATKEFNCIFLREKSPLVPEASKEWSSYLGKEIRDVIPLVQTELAFCV